MKNLKKIPKFRNEHQERKFWAKADSSKYFDWNKRERALFPNLKPTTEAISIRVPKYLLARIKELANSKDVPYQSLIKIFLSDRVHSELKRYRI
ncbi:MAG: BrnA antitoxin family protein [Elusimicrobia bacterium]|nr:BrnA antitoxin family protein [Elusimicrobiota bacterium]